MNESAIDSAAEFIEGLQGSFGTPYYHRRSLRQPTNIRSAARPHSLWTNTSQELMGVFNKRNEMKNTFIKDHGRIATLLICPLKSFLLKTN